MKKIISLLLCAVLLTVSFSACGNSNEPNDSNNTNNTEQTEKTDNNAYKGENRLVLPYSQGDTQNPYTCSSQLNNKLMTLMYDSLFTLSSEYEAEGLLADVVDVQKDNVTVTLKKNAVFSDGNKVTANDVAYSFDMAKSSKAYCALLQDVASCTAADEFTVSFSLSKADPYILSALIFPVVESYTGEYDVPVGSGRYVLSGKKLTYNKKHISGEKANIKTIYLYNLTNSENDISLLQIGNISVVYKDLSDCKVQRATAQSILQATNNLVYLGLNSKSGELKDEKLRKAVNYAIDRSAVKEDCYQSFGEVTDTPFNPQWYALPEKTKTAYNQSSAVTVLDKNGYKYYYSTDRYRSQNGKGVTLTILTDKTEFKKSTAEKVKQLLSEVGLNSVIVEKSKSAYKAAVKSGSFDIYVGEIKLCENMSLRPFFSGSAKSGISTKLSVVAAYDKMLNGEINLSEFIDIFNEDLPFIPLLYRKAVLFASNALENNVEAGVFDIYQNITKWKFAD